MTHPTDIMKQLSPFAIFALLLILTSCAVPQYISVPVNYNPRAYFSKDSTNIVMVSKFNPDNLKIGNKKKLAAIKAGAYTAIKTAGMQLNLLPHVHAVNLVDSASFPVDTASVKSIAQKYNANYVLVLKDFRAGIAMDEIDNNQAYYNTNVTVNFLLYEDNGIYYKKLSGTADDPKDSQPYMGLLASIVFQPSVGHNKTAINASAEHAVQNAFQDYFPYTVTHSRPLYNDDYLKPAVREILAGNFNKADSLLQPFLQDPKAETASKAAYNLAVVYEAEGDIGAAIDMAQESSDKYVNQFAVAILNDLKQE
ncbi:MAG TPA: DUF6340 family protein [Mucilaginibacter sp.]|nr:DUF6340 family protein [Mucilaginibacter sp.]